jgi:hypothetical protein
MPINNVERTGNYEVPAGLPTENRDLKRAYLPYAGILRFSKGGRDHCWGSGTFGESTGVKVKGGDIAVQLRIENPNEGAEKTPSISFAAKMPRDPTEHLVYVDDRSTSHTVEFKFMAGVGEISYKKIQRDDPYLSSLMAKNPKVELPEYVMCVRFSENQTNGYRPLVIGHNWPCIPLDEKGRDVIETTPQCIQAAQWEVYLPYTESLEGSLIGVGEMFAKKGRGFNLDQYMTKGKVQ